MCGTGAKDFGQIIPYDYRPNFGWEISSTHNGNRTSHLTYAVETDGRITTYSYDSGILATLVCTYYH